MEGQSRKHRSCSLPLKDKNREIVGVGFKMYDKI